MIYIQSLNNIITYYSKKKNQNKNNTQSIPPLTSINTTPTTTPINLKTLFKNTNLQQQTTNKTKPQKPQPFHKLITNKQFVKKSYKHFLLIIYNNI